jgi:hypothetical protein
VARADEWTKTVIGGVAFSWKAHAAKPNARLTRRAGESEVVSILSFSDVSKPAATSFDDDRDVGAARRRPRAARRDPGLRVEPRF